MSEAVLICPFCNSEAEHVTKGSCSSCGAVIKVRGGIQDSVHKSLLWRYTIGFFLGRFVARIVGLGLDALGMQSLASSSDGIENLYLVAGFNQLIIAFVVMFFVTQSEQWDRTWGFYLQLTLAFLMSTLAFIYLGLEGLIAPQNMLFGLVVSFAAGLAITQWNKKPETSETL